MAQNYPSFLVLCILLSALVGAVSMSIVACLCTRFSHLMEDKPRKTVVLPRAAFEYDTDEEEEAPAVAAKDGVEKKED